MIHIIKDSFKKLLLVVVFISLVIPAYSRAATPVTDGIDSWRSYSKTLKKKIDALGDDIEKNIAIPILFGVELDDISPNFGDARGEGRTHEGEDIMGTKGTPIVTPTDAVVLRTGTGPSSGNYVYTANPGGEIFVYMHLDTIADIAYEDVLHEGDVIGTVGDTGNASGGASHLHFEIREDDHAVDPYPRITKEYSLKEKMAFLDSLLDDVGNKNTLVKFLISEYSSVFASAKKSGIKLPSEIQKLVTGTVSSVVSIPHNSNTNTSDLELGFSGDAVIVLQKKLIEKNAGVEARALKLAGATGYFGVRTQAALIEFQKSVNIVPSDGYYGSITRAALQSDIPSISTDDVQLMATSSVPVPVTTPTTSSSLIPKIDLERGAVGDDVLWLQNYLIQELVGSAALKLKSNGATGYFGQLTVDALIEYQQARGIAPALGYFGAKTRASIK